jgi:NADH dehydrogenase FAD-containing subunit
MPWSDSESSHCSSAEPSTAAVRRALTCAKCSEIQLGATVTDVDREGLTVKDADGTIRRIESACKVWSAGVSASRLGERIAEQSGAEIDRAGRVNAGRVGRVKVLPDLTVNVQAEALPK